VSTLQNQFPFQIIDGFRRSAGEITSNKSSFPSGFASDKNQLLQQLVGDATENNLPLVLEASQKRFNALLEDRNRIGRDLHDCVLQPLFAISLSLEMHSRACATVPSETKCRCDQSIEQLNKLIHEIARPQSLDPRRKARTVQYHKRSLKQMHSSCSSEPCHY
jgi:signal transduction histidine kinase